MVLYVPGTEERDLKKVIMSLQQIAAAVTSFNIQGVIDGSNAVTGNVGEYIESVVPSGSAVALTSGAQKTVTSISLTPGDWDVNAICYHSPAATTSVTRYGAGISLVDNVISGVPGRFSDFNQAALVTGGPTFNNAIPPYRLNVTVTTPVYLVAIAAFTISTLGAYGLLRARRVR